jgi:hypothetical protein
VEAAGIEPEDAISQDLEGQQFTMTESPVSALCLHGNVTQCRLSSTIDPMLSRLAELWPSLQASTRTKILAICVDGVLLADV